MATETALLTDIGATIVTATILGFIAKALKQPPIVGYVLAGILVGPSFLRIINEHNTIEVLSHIGITLLLFMVGLELDLKRLRDVGRVSLGCGIGQIVITFIFGYLLAMILGFTGLEVLYIAIALTISSTMVVVKLLSDRNELDTLHGKIVLGTLLVQDVFTILILATLPTLDNFSPIVLLKSFMIAFGLMVFAIIANKYLLPPVMRYAAKSVELLFLFSLSCCFLFAAATYLLFLSLFMSSTFALNSISIGAFLAGISLATYPYNLEIVGRIRPLKDFFITIFFASLGMQVVLSGPPIEMSSGESILESGVSIITAILQSQSTSYIAIFSLYVLLGTVLIMLVITTLFGYGKRTAFLTAISLAQISEFSLILVVQGLQLGHISDNLFSIITGVVLVTITISSYFITYGKQLYSLSVPALSILDKIPGGRELEEIPEKSNEHVIVCGCHRMGSRIVDTLRRINERFIVVDYNPNIIKKLIKQNIPAIYGDVGDPEIFERIDLHAAKLVISTVPDQDSNLLLIYETKTRNPKTLVFIAAEDLEQALELYNAGADYVIVPKMVGGEKVSDLMEKFIKDKHGIKKIKEEQIFKLEDLQKEDFLWQHEPSFLRALERRVVGPQKVDNHIRHR